MRCYKDASPTGLENELASISEIRVKVLCVFVPSMVNWEHLTRPAASLFHPLGEGHRPGQWLVKFRKEFVPRPENHCPVADWLPPAAKLPLGFQVAISDTVALQSLYCVEPPTARMRTL